MSSYTVVYDCASSSWDVNVKPILFIVILTKNNVYRFGSNGVPKRMMVAVFHQSVRSLLKLEFVL
jgi:hypothetical protein